MWPEVIRSTYGGWTLLKRDPNGFQFFTPSLSSFWFSFLTIIPITLIGQITLGIAVALSDDPSDSFGEPLINTVLSSFIAMAVFALIMIPFSARGGRPEGYFAFMIAWHWTGMVVSILFQSIFVAIAINEVIGSAAFEVVFNLAAIAFLIYQALVGMFIARHTLKVTPLNAFAIVAIAFGVAIVTAIAIDTLSQGLTIA